MNKLKTAKRVLNASLSKITEKVECEIFGADKVEVSLYLAKVDNLEIKINELFEKIFETCKENEIDSFVEESCVMQESIDKLKITLMHLESKISDSSKVIASQDVVNVKLPEFHIPKFSGVSNIEWISFSDLFWASVGQNNKISQAQKLQYLRGSLTGDALRVIQSLPISDTNFEIAWNLLKERYSNKRELVFALLERFMSMQQLKTESAQGLLSIVDTSKEIIRSLQSMDMRIEGFADTIFVFNIMQKLDASTKTWWERNLSDDNLPTVEKLLTFLTSHSRTLQQDRVQIPRQKTKFNSFTSQIRKEKAHCVLCSAMHHVQSCADFLNLSVQQRFSIARAQGLCFNCLSKHHVSDCKSKFKCRECNKRHHTLLHYTKEQASSASPLSVNAAEFSPQVSAIPKSSETELTTFSSCVQHSPKQVLLCTAKIKVLDASNQVQSFRALLDPGSEASFISEAGFQRLGISKKNARLQINCLGSSDARTNGITNITFSPHFSPEPVYRTSVYIVKKIIGDLPHSPLDARFTDQFSDLILADPNFNRPGPVDILLGVDLALPLLKGEIIRRCPGSPFAVRSQLGWIVAGSADLAAENTAIHVNNIQVTTDTLVSNFWKLDSVPAANLLTEKEQACETHFLETHSRGEGGKYVVKLPFHTMPLHLGDSKEMAIRRFYSLERSLSCRPEVYDQYKSFMREYLQLGHMEKVPESELTKRPNFYLPHHAVLKDTSTTTRLRVVFDASARSSTGLSLNDILMTGPRVQQELFSILLRFRTFRVAVCADIEKMFRQIWIHPENADCQRIIWRDTPMDPISVYRLTTVTYGTACAPYLSTRVMNQLALDEKQSFPLASKICLRDFYVDDLLSGASSEEEATELINQMHQMMSRGGFPLRKWVSNCPSVLENIPMELKASDVAHTIDNDSSVKVLGIAWLPSTDMFTFTISVSDHKELTKRKVLSDVARIFDPLGWLAPTVIIAKIFIQELWNYNLGWDEVLSEPLATRWKNFQEKLPLLTKFKIPRFILAPQPIDIQVHAFCDSSERAYCAAIYLRSVNCDQTVNVALLTSKTRVAPVKTQSLPRLELCSALLLTNLLEVVLPTLELSISRTFAWSDSTVALAWIASEPRRWLPFVANRVSKIQEATPGIVWNHVSSQDNPADCATRGLPPEQLLNCTLWTCGPQFLYKPFDHLIKGQPPQFNFEESHLQEMKKSSVVTATRVHTDSLTSKFSSFMKLCRVVAWCLRFRKNCSLAHAERVSGHLSCDEISRATLVIVKCVQEAEFHEDLSNLKAGRPVKPSSKLVSLSPFLDSDGILRVGGRLRHSRLSEDSKHPMIIPKSHHLTNLIVQYFHLKHLHAAPQLLLSVIRQKFWIPCGRDVVRRFVNSCVTCFRLAASSMTQIMGDLPASRVVPSRPFSKSGVDFAGPFLAKERNGRGKRSFKVYVAIFVCFATRAIHLEVVSDLTSQAFIAALKRFFARRGRSEEIVSDCGSNFIGANRELKASLKSLLTSKSDNSVSNFVSSEGIKWKFNPPGAPHFGGLWESGVKSMKYHLRRTMGESLLSLEELNTLTAQIEACLNSRPLCPLSSDPNDLAPLTPGHFLIGTALTAIPEPDLSTIPQSRLGRWQLVQRLLQQFWKRWNMEFLSRLQQRPKWCRAKANIAVNDLVLVKNELLPPLKWKLARVIHIHPGIDEKVRVVTVQTDSGQLKRPISKICKLPLD